MRRLKVWIISQLPADIFKPKRSEPSISIKPVITCLALVAVAFGNPEDCPDPQCGPSGTVCVDPYVPPTCPSPGTPTAPVCPNKFCVPEGNTVKLQLVVDLTILNTY